VKYTFNINHPVYVIIYDERIEEGIITKASNQWLHVKTATGRFVTGYYGDSIFFTMEKAEKVFTERVRKKQKKASIQKINEEAERKAYEEGTRYSVCEVCGKKSPLYNKLCECKPYIR